jgi:acyl-CoA reductase-like NAD-dependent aldehyde dehydrogenase
VFGSGDDAGAVLQPVVSEASLDRLLGYVTDAVGKGARKIHGGGKVDRVGYFMEPTILADTTDEMKCSCEEIFGYGAHFRT